MRILKNTPLSSKIHCYVKNRNGLYLNRYRSNCKSVGSLLRASPKLVRKQGKVYLSSKHKRRGYLGGVSRYQTRVLSKSLSLCTCNYPFYSAYKSLIHRVNFGQFKLSTDIEKNPGPSVYVDATKKKSCSILSRKRCSIWGKCGTTMCCNDFCALIYSKIRRITLVDDMIQIMTVGSSKKWLQCLSDFSSLNTVKVILVTYMVNDCMPLYYKQ